MSEKKILFKNLTKLITEPALYYDEGIAKYLIQRIGEESLREFSFIVPESKALCLIMPESLNTAKTSED